MTWRRLGSGCSHLSSTNCPCTLSTSQQQQQGQVQRAAAAAAAVTAGATFCGRSLRCTAWSCRATATWQRARSTRCLRATTCAKSTRTARPSRCAEMPFRGRHFILKTDQFAKTGSGQACRTSMLSNKGVFSAAGRAQPGLVRWLLGVCRRGGARGSALHRFDQPSGSSRSRRNRGKVGRSRRRNRGKVQAAQSKHCRQQLRQSVALAGVLYGL